MFRFRNAFIFLGSLVVLALYLLTDPDAGLIQDLPWGANTVIILTMLLKAIWFIAILHLGRNALIDYVDLSKYFEKALTTSEGAGSAIIGVGLIFLAVAVVVFAAVVS